MARAHDPAATAGRRASSSLRILLVDDDASLRFMLSILFDDPKVEAIFQAGDGEAALDVAAREEPNVIVCDCRMPVMSGDEAGRRLRIAHPEALIVSYSGLDEEKPWADEAITKASGDDIERLKATILGPE
jgi:CheY-like chemotaxis protein